MSRVMMIGLDAAEARLIERWTDDGTLPNLARLRARGAYGRLSSSARWLVGSPWPTFYTGTGPETHGLYHYLMWDPDRMEAVRPGREDFPEAPFWRRLGPRDRRVVAVDVPFVFPPDPFDGVELGGWATHDRLGPPCAHPPELLAEIERTFGPAPLQEEVHRPMSPERLLAVRDELVRMTDAVTGVAESLARRESWDLFLAAYSATHRGGHKLWIDPAMSVPDDETGRAMRSALRDVYVAIDRGIGRLVHSAGEDTTILAFALHGMGPNTCHTAILDEMVRRILSGPREEAGAGRKMAVLKALRRAVPLSIRNEVKRRLPLGLQDRLTSFWRTGGLDWSTTRAFCPVADLQGYVRVNLRGREREGIVAPGAEYDALCREIAEGLRTFVDADTGQPLVRSVERIDSIFPDGPRRDGLPDLLVDWTRTSVLTRREIHSPRFGTIPWPDPGRPPDGRTGNHRTEGFLLAAGQGFDTGGALEGAILDLAPTALELLDLPPFPEMRGRSLARFDEAGISG